MIWPKCYFINILLCVILTQTQSESYNSRLKLPKPVYPHELKNIILEKPLVYHPQPFAYPGYPVILYL
ncbi:hypothetical protein K1T71_010225 [Dendrolimus kikuchii]|uniref:Uncharacterized protein n=1 Tax=Dendrolimus kikuchii TaxID=765133 RepID=A0ACC1CR11_9NEOP|nr:hypothetical protein K1T71_010225 [Dendrolimus kikuchii]